MDFAEKWEHSCSYIHDDNRVGSSHYRQKEGKYTMKKEHLSNIGTIVVSLLATSCCLGPAIFVVFGTSIGFLGNLSFMEPLRPYFLGAAFLMAGFSFWKLYVRKRIECACEEDIRTRK